MTTLRKEYLAALLFLILGTALGFAAGINNGYAESLLENIPVTICANKKPSSLIKTTTQVLQGRVGSINDHTITLASGKDSLSFTIRDETPVFSPAINLATPSAQPKGVNSVNPPTPPTLGNLRDLKVGQNVMAQVMSTAKGLEALSVSITSTTAPAQSPSQ